jgi:hypothetical protein
MHIVLAVVGIPDRIFDILKAVPEYSLVGDGVTLGRFKLSRAPNGQYHYSPSEAEKIQAWFEKIAVPRLQANLITMEVCCAAICMNYQGMDQLVQSLFPWALCMPVERPKFPEGVESAVNRRVAKSLQVSVQAAMKRVRQTLGFIKHELTEARNSTPMLLPLGNFQSSDLVSGMRSLAAGIGATTDAGAQLGDFKRKVAKSHWRKSANFDGRKHFVDDAGKVFKAPASNHMHGIAQGISNGHISSCVLNGRLRLGAAFQPAFHFDCQYESGRNFIGSLPSCHGQLTTVQGRAYVNISPNDHIR